MIKASGEQRNTAIGKNGKIKANNKKQVLEVKDECAIETIKRIMSSAQLKPIITNL